MDKELSDLKVHFPGIFKFVKGKVILVDKHFMGTGIDGTSVFESRRGPTAQKKTLRSIKLNFIRLAFVTRCTINS